MNLALEVIQTAGKSHPRPVFNELSSRIRRHQKSISKGLKSGDETRIYMFLRHVVESAFDELAELSEDIAARVQTYRDELHSDVGVIYQVRRSYDESVTQINDTIGAYLDRQQEIAQLMIPHYFEKFKTDGVDHNIYVGDSLLESGKCSALDLRNLYLWQLMSMCGVVVDEATQTHVEHPSGYRASNSPPIEPAQHHFPNGGEALQRRWGVQCPI